MRDKLVFGVSRALLLLLSLSAHAQLEPELAVNLGQRGAAQSSVLAERPNLETLRDSAVSMAASTGLIGEFDVDNTHAPNHHQFMLVRVLVPMAQGQILPGQAIEWSLEMPGFPGVLVPGYSEVVRWTYQPGTANRRDALFVRFETLAYIGAGRAEVFRIHNTPGAKPRFSPHPRILNAMGSGLIGNYPEFQVKVLNDPRIYKARLKDAPPYFIYNNPLRTGYRWNMELFDSSGAKLSGLIATALIEIQAGNSNFEIVVGFGAGRLEEPVEKIDIEWAKVITRDDFRLRFRDPTQASIQAPTQVGDEEHHTLLDSTRFSSFLGDGQWVSFRAVGGVNPDLVTDPYGMAQVAASIVRADIGVIRYDLYRQVYADRFANDVWAGMPYLPTRQFSDIATVRSGLRRPLPVPTGTPFSHKDYLSQNPPGAGLQTGMQGGMALPGFIQRAIQAETPEPIRNVDFAILQEALRGNLYVHSKNGVIRPATVFDYPNMAILYFQMRTVRNCGPSGGYQFYERNNGTWRGYDNQHVYLFALIYYYLFTGDLWSLEQIDHHGTVLAWNFYTEDPVRKTGMFKVTASERGRRTDMAFASIAAARDGTTLATAIRYYLDQKFSKIYRPQVNTYMNAFNRAALLATFKAPAASCAICNQYPNLNFIIGWQRPHSEAAFCLASIYGIGGLNAFTLMADYHHSTANQFGFDQVTGEPVAYVEVSNLTNPTYRASASSAGFSQQVWADAACSTELLRTIRPAEHQFWQQVVYPRFRNYFRSSHGGAGSRPYRVIPWGYFNSQAQWISNPLMDY